MKTTLRLKVIQNIFLLAVLILASCDNPSDHENQTVPHEGRWGVYVLDLTNNTTQLIYSGSEKISGLRLDPEGSYFVFSEITGGSGDDFEEIFKMAIDGSKPERLTNNNYLDVYPAWSPDGSRIAFLSRREIDLDIYVMDADGSNVERLYDSGTNDADIHWVGDQICFTRNSQIWIIDDNGSNPSQVTDPPKAGEWGNANLPFGDFDPRLSPDGTKIVYERLKDDISPNGNYDIYLINKDGSGEEALTNNGFTQGLASWSHTGNEIVYLISAVAGEGKYDLYLMNADGGDNRSLTPDYFDPLFLIHSGIFSKDDSKIFFIGEWWE